MNASQIRDCILGQWETLEQPYYAHCNLHADYEPYDSFDLLEDQLGWRDVAMCSFRWEESGQVYPGRFWKKGILLFPARVFTEKEIQTCLDGDRLAVSLTKFVEDRKQEVYAATKRQRWKGEDYPDLPSWGDLKEYFLSEFGNLEDVDAVNWEAIKLELQEFIDLNLKLWRQRPAKGTNF